MTGIICMIDTDEQVLMIEGDDNYYPFEPSRYIQIGGRAIVSSGVATSETTGQEDTLFSAAYITDIVKDLVRTMPDRNYAFVVRKVGARYLLTAIGDK